ncbi:MAG: metallophosphoesterase [Thiothrix sp.]|nr:metallophosphoesterase [Thiothrix sp.]HPE62060.1 metallophosphoesterase [Thiolinea sp.]
MDTHQPVRLLQISDLHCFAGDDSALLWSDLPVQPNRQLSRLLTHLQQLPDRHDALIISGDLAQEETAATYERLGQLLEGLGLPIYVLPGNHDVPSLMRVHLTNADGQPHYQSTVRIGDWQLLFLDTSKPGHPDGHLEPEKLALLEQQLSAAQQTPTLIFMHHHPVPINSPWMDHMGLQQAERFWQLLAQHPQVRGIGFGHIHNAFETHIETAAGHSVQVCGTPATCIQLGHETEKMTALHTRPGWREWILSQTGTISSQVNYLDPAVE